MLLRWLTGSAIVACTLCGVACTTGAGDGRVWGSLYLPECGVVDEDYDMGVDFFAASYFDNTLQIRLQNGGQDQTLTDGVVIQVRDVELLANSPGQTFEITVEPTLEEFMEQGPDIDQPETTWDSPARVTLFLNGTCPDNTLGFTDGVGTITFHSIYQPDVSKRIKGGFHLRFIDPRTWSGPGEIGAEADLFGEFDFNYSRGAPAQAFPK
jgi:hypothetical protein